MRLLKAKVLFILISVLFLLNCAEEDQDVPNLNKGFALANGDPISQPDTDDYNPQVMVKSDGFLILIFGSNRATATGGGPGSNHHLWATQSTGPFDPVNGMPTFNTPTQLSLSNLTSETDKIAFSAQSDGGAGAYLVFTEGASGSSNMYFATFVDFSDGTPDAEVTYKGEATATARTGTVIGNTGMISPGSKEFIYKSPSANTIKIAQHADPSAVTDGSLGTQGISDKSVIASVPTSISGAPNSYFYTNVDSSGFFSFILAGSGDSVAGEPIALNDAIFFEGLVVGAIDTFAHPNGNPALSGMVFSAGFDISGDQDLFYVSSHDLFGLWQLNLGPQNSIVGPGFSFLPPDMGGLQVWYDGFGIFDPPGAISGWYDNNFNLDLMPANTGAIFKVDGPLGLPTVNFDGSVNTLMNDGSMFASQFPTGMTVGTVFAVANYDGTAFPGGNHSSLLSFQGNGTALIEGTGGGTQLQTNGVTMRINGHGSSSQTDFSPLKLHKVVTAVFASPVSITGTDFEVGGHSANTVYWNGDIAEVIVYDRVLSAGEIDQVENHLSEKYSIPLFSPTLGANNANLLFWGRADENQTASASLPAAATFNQLSSGSFGSFTGGTQVNIVPAFPAGPPVRAIVDNATTLNNASNLSGSQYTIIIAFSPASGSISSSPMTLFANHGASNGIEIGFNGAGPYDQIELRKNNATQLIAGPPILDDQFQIITVAGAPSGAAHVFYNGIALGNMAGAYTAEGGAGTTLFNGNLGNFSGAIAEVLIYDVELTDPVRNEITCYMAKRYYVPVASCFQ